MSRVNLPRERGNGPNRVDGSASPGETCAQVSELLPDLVSGRAGQPLDAETAAHLAECARCRDEMTLVSLLWDTRPQVPTGLADRIRDRIEAGGVGHERPVSSVGPRRGRGMRRVWARSRAGWRAVAVLAAIALGIGYASTRFADQPVPGYAYELSSGSIWIAEDGMIAGEPDLSSLSHEALVELLADLSSSGDGEAG